MYEFNWLLTLAFRQNGTGKQTDKETKRDRQRNRQTDRQTKRAKHKRKGTCILAVVWACRVVCWCALRLSVADICRPPQSTKYAFVLYYAYNIANI